MVTIDAANETDMARALGYVHAQERYFEMDLMRRSSAGELAELFGPIALDLDKEHRVHRMRARVMANLDAFAGDKVAQLQAYTDGVNAGLDDLKVRPWPYLLLRQQPRRWELADSALTGYAMYFDLQDSQNTRELALWKIKPHVPPALFALLTRDGTEWDAPLFGEARGNAVLPGAERSRPGETADAGETGPGTPLGKRLSRQQQLGGFRRIDRRRPRHRRRRHAPGAARAEHLVPRAIALSRRARAGRQGGYFRIHPARHAGGDRRQQPPYRLGIHQQLWRLGGLGPSSRMPWRHRRLRRMEGIPRSHQGRRRQALRPGRPRNFVGAGPA